MSRDGLDYMTMMRVVERSCWPGMMFVDWDMMQFPQLILGYKLIMLGCQQSSPILNEHLLEEFADIGDVLNQ